MSIVKSSCVVVGLVALSIATGCAAETLDEAEDGGDESALVSGNGPQPIKNQESRCDGSDFLRTTLGPFGRCKDVLLKRVMVAEYTDEHGRKVPAHPDTPARWEGWNLPMAFPAGWKASDVGKLEVVNETTGDDSVKFPILCAPITFYIGPKRLLGQGIQVKEGKNRFVYRITRQGTTEPLVYRFEATFRKAP